MSGLLHIKRFRQNMFKLFAIYLVVILSTTSVITYSRYITSMESESSTRPAKFNIDISQGQVCVADSTINCGLDNYKPYDKLDYPLSVATTHLEVTTLVVITIDINTDYTFDSIYEVVDDVATPIDISSNADYTIDSVNNTIKIIRTISAGNGDSKNYKVRLSYNEDSATGTTPYAIQVVFSAKQED